MKQKSLLLVLTAFLIKYSSLLVFWNVSNVKQASKNLGVILDQHMKFELHVKKVVQSCFFQLRNFAKIKSVLFFRDLEKKSLIFLFPPDMIIAMHCSPLHHTSVSQLQLIQNAASKLLTKTWRRSHITPLSAILHWLPIECRSDFNILLIIYKALHGLAPLYMRSLGSLRSSDQGLLAVPKTRRKAKGDRAFAVVTPTFGKCPPLALRNTESVDSFKKLLKTHLFRKHSI